MNPHDHTNHTQSWVDYLQADFFIHGHLYTKQKGSIKNPNIGYIFCPLHITHLGLLINQIPLDF